MEELPEAITRIRLLGVPVDCVNMATAVAVADNMVASRRRGAILAINPEKIVAASDQPELLGLLEATTLLIPDGIGAVVAAWLRGYSQVRRVPGAELMPELCALARRQGYGVYLFGGRPEVNKRVAELLPEQFPGLRIVGRHHGYVDDTEQQALLDDINRSGAQILFVALGSPRQEYWIHQHLEELRTVCVAQGVGGTFDVIAGRVKRAPKIWRVLWLEWFYRFLQEPSRIKRIPALLRFTGRALLDRRQF